MTEKRNRSRIWRERFAAAAGDERGSVTAEFALVLPAVLLVFAVLITGIAAGAKQISVTAAAAEIARLEAREDDGAASTYIAGLPADFSISRATSNGMLCVTVAQRGSVGIRQLVQVRGHSCALLLNTLQ
ncbi:pilus assembly protein [Leucobacter sp. OH2974_COT-288]|nr:pilus assembly protein [Leucobacter sp. OH2974_COT-288]